VLLSLAALVISLAGCGGKNDRDWQATIRTTPGAPFSVSFSSDTLLSSSYTLSTSQGKVVYLLYPAISGNPARSEKVFNNQVFQNPDSWGQREGATLHFIMPSQLVGGNYQLCTLNSDCRNVSVVGD
jgi:hypothetical protein